MEQTFAFLKNMPKSKRKNKRQFFTLPNIARFMAKMFDANSFNKNHIFRFLIQKLAQVFFRLLS